MPPEYSLLAWFSETGSWGTCNNFTSEQPKPQVFATPGSSSIFGTARLICVGSWMSGAVSGAGWKPPSSAEAQAIEQDARAIALTLTDEVGQAYFRVRALNEQVEIALSVLTLRRDSSEIIAKRASVGLGLRPQRETDGSSGGRKCGTDSGSESPVRHCDASP